MRRTASILIVAITLSMMISPVTARADDFHAGCVAAGSDAEIDARYAFVAEELEQGVRPSRWWHWGWLSLTFGAVTIQATIAATVSVREVQVASVYGAIGPFLAMMTHLNGPLPGVLASETLSRMPARNPADRRARLYEAESLLRASLRRERWERGWFPFTSMFVLPSVIGGAIWLGYDYRWSALRVGLTNIAGSLGRIFTYPRWASRAWARYQDRFGHPLCEAYALPRPAPAMRVELLPAPGGAQLRLTF